MNKAQYPMPNPITPKNPRGAGKVKKGHAIRLMINQLSDAAFDKLKELAQSNERSAYLRKLIERDIKNISGSQE
jgi:hypothetical protein